MFLEVSLLASSLIRGRERPQIASSSLASEGSVIALRLSGRWAVLWAFTILHGTFAQLHFWFVCLLILKMRSLSGYAPGL